ncbi:MAG: mechanosensitive ion channel domain-containing protein [Burkholderiaceae bacterium]
MSHTASLHRFIVAGLFAVFAVAGLAQQPDAGRPGILAEGARISNQIEEVRAALDQQRTELAALQQAKATLDERMRWVERRARVTALGGEFSQTLMDYLRQLPGPERFRALRGKHAEQMAAASDEELRVERVLHEIKAGQAAGMKPGAPLQPPAAAASSVLLDQGQRDALEQLAVLLRESLETLEKADALAQELEQQTVAARRALAGYLLWIPTPPSTRTLTEVMPSLAWSLSPTNWRAASGFAADELARRPFWPVLALLTAGTLLAARRRLRRWLVAFSPEFITWGRFHIRYAVAAFAITLALAVPVPLVLWTGAALLSTAPTDQGFVLSLSLALRMVATLLLGLSSLVWLIDPDGLSIRYFGRSAASLDAAARTLRRFMVIFVLLFAIAALNMVEHAPNANRESLGRLALGFVLLGSVAFLARHLRRGGPLVQRLVANAPHSWGVRLHPVWYSLLVAAPLAGLFFTAAGYSIAAAFFWTRLVESLFLALGASVLYGMVGLWMKVQRLELVQVPDAATAQAAVVEGDVAGVGRLPLPDVGTLGEQARSLLHFLITLGLATGLWWVWLDAVPALQWIGDYALWRDSETVGGKEVLHVLTVGQLFRAILVGVLAGVAVSRVGALLDIVLQRRLELRADATYAIKAITRYSIAAAGILVVSSILGIGWGDVQWLIAALGVGLGFGLQEIVANFVSGLIVLAERPIRIGDVITVDKTTGKVARIRARATVVVDFDNKEVIIPNKTFITGPVVNWTLSSQVSRIVLKFGVPYGSDIAGIQQRIVEEVGLLPEVLPDPPPAVFFTAFAEKSLDFEIHAFVGSVNDRFRVQHEINLAAERVLREQGGEISSP